MSRREYYGQPADPKTRTCDWCGKKAARAFELHKPLKKLGTAQYIYTCIPHEALGKEASRAKRRAA